MVTILGFEQGLASPCNFWHKDRNLRTTVHGDDFETLGPYSQLQWFSTEPEVDIQFLLYDSVDAYISDCQLAGILSDFGLGWG